jgi:hypothetical protein
LYMYVFGVTESHGKNMVVIGMHLGRPTR